MTSRNTLVALILVAVLGLLVWSGVHNFYTRRAQEQAQVQRMSLQTDKPGATVMTDDEGPEQNFRGKPAANFSLKTRDGKTVTLADLKGKPVLLNFWATWCTPCKVEMPWFEEFSKKYSPQGLVVVGVDEDDEANTPKVQQDITSTVKNLGVDYTILMTDHKIDNQYGGMDMLPTTFYIDRNGVIQAQAVGLAPKEQAEANVHKILGS